MCFQISILQHLRIYKIQCNLEIRPIHFRCIIVISSEEKVHITIDIYSTFYGLACVVCFIHGVMGMVPVQVM